MPPLSLSDHLNPTPPPNDVPALCPMLAPVRGQGDMRSYVWPPFLEWTLALSAPVLLLQATPGLGLSSSPVLTPALLCHFHPHVIKELE